MSISQLGTLCSQACLHRIDCKFLKDRGVFCFFPSSSSSTLSFLWPSACHGPVHGMTAHLLVNWSIQASFLYNKPYIAWKAHRIVSSMSPVKKGGDTMDGKVLSWVTFRVASQTGSIPPTMLATPTILGTCFLQKVKKIENSK